MNLYWISWYQPGEDYRPLTYPPNDGIVGWWCSGIRDGDSTLCAYVQANDEEQARAAVRKDWPEASEWRFCEQHDSVHNNGRFPPSEWMLPRMKQWVQQP